MNKPSRKAVTCLCRVSEFTGWTLDKAFVEWEKWCVSPIWNKITTTEIAIALEAILYLWAAEGIADIAWEQIQNDAT